VTVALWALRFDRAIVGFRRSLVCFGVIALLPALFLALAPAHAGAAEEMRLTWGDCGVDGRSVQPFNCNQPAFSRSFYVAACPADSLTLVVGASMVFDVITDSAVLPDWWRLAIGECRAGKLAADADFTATTSCVDAWNLEGGALVQSYTTRPGGGANQTRLVATAGVTGVHAVTLPGGEPRALIRVFMYLSDAASGTCAGCATGACIVVNSVELVRVPGAPGGDQTLTQTAEPGSNFVTWQSGASCITVPARNRTWGQIKALYR
jgi:hypothetical protein